MIINIYALFKLRIITKQYEESVSTNINLHSDTKKYLDHCNLLSNSFIPEELKESIPLLNPHLWSALESEKLVFFIPQNACSSCIQSVLLYLESIAGEIGYDKIMIVINLPHNDKSIQMIDPSDFSFNYYLLNSFHLKIEELNEPFLFITDKNLKISLLFIPEVATMQQRHDYFHITITSYFK